jgi:hypothetical protein
MRLITRLFSVVCTLVGAIFFLAVTAQACPMCSQSIANDDVLPHAYMYSIIFMLTMPAVVLGGIGSVIYFQFRKLGATVPAGDSLAEFAPDAESRELATQP